MISYIKLLILKKKVLVLVLSITFCDSQALELPAFFSNGMVLQQKATVAVWGKSKNDKVTLITSWDNRTYDVDVVNGKWKLDIVTAQAGGPYVIQIFDSQKRILIKDVLLGEVWLASGQSNMEMPIKGFNKQPVNNSSEVAENSTNKYIRFFNVENKTWGQKLDNANGEWLYASPNTTPNFSATAYFFALKLYEKLKVPIAIIQADWGGTPIQAWMSAESVQHIKRVKVNNTVGNAALSSKNSPTGLFNAMIHPLLGYGVKGVIWYQGEANRIEPKFYQMLFPIMVKQWRKDWGIGDFPFYYVQIAPFETPETSKSSDRVRRAENYSPYLRESQLLCNAEIPNSGMAVLMDIGSQATIHPPDKASVGERLSYEALNKTYGYKDVFCGNPTYVSMRKDGNSIVLTMDNADGLYLKTGYSENFEIAGEDKIFYPASVEVLLKEIKISSSKVKKPVAARYAFKAWAQGDLFNSYNLPASSFRTDNWSFGDVKSSE